MFNSLPICRVCLKTSLEYIDFDTPFDVDSKNKIGNDLTYLDCFMACTRLEVEASDNCPQSLCSACGLELKIAYEFIQKAESADRALREYAANTKLEKLDEEDNAILCSDTTDLYEHFDNEDEIKQNNIDTETFEQEDGLMEDEKNYVCTICGDQFFSQFVLNLHVTRSHPDDNEETNFSIGKVECRICDLVMPLAKFNSHMQQHQEENTLELESVTSFNTYNNDEPLIDVGEEAHIELLSIGADSSNEMLNHASSVEESQEESTTAQIDCDLNPPDEEEDDHLHLKIESNFNPDVKFSVIEKILTDQEKTRVTKPNYRRCNVCNRHVRSVSFEAHMNIHNGIRQFSCEHCPGTFFSKRSLQTHIKTTHREHIKSICRICHESVDNLDMKTHINDNHLRTVKCTQCDYQGQEVKMKEHMKRRHAESRDFLCNICSKFFGSLSSLNSHMRHHKMADKKEETCDVCGKMFSSKHTLRTHQKVHDANRQSYPCDLCEKIYYSKTALNGHQRLHNGTTIKCVQCPKEFIHQAEYKIHLRFHTNDFPFQCEKCGSKFATKGHLNTHINKHLGWKLKCKECGKLFSGRKAYADHSFKHTVMPYPCPNCKRGYPTRSKLKSHLKASHSIDVPIDELNKLCIFKPDKKIRTRLEWIKVPTEDT